jgi:predicted porin
MFAKKNLVAAAALMVVAGVAQADVKLYGTIDMSVGSYEKAHTKNDATKAGYRTTKVESGDMITSFLGFAGSEDLGGGLKAEFTLETFLKADTGSSSSVYNTTGGFWGRGSNVALSGGFGKVAIGQYDNPLFTSGYTYNPFGSSMTFSPTMRHFYYNQAGVGQSNAGVAFDTGFVNSVTYETPNLSGFTATAQYSPKETATNGYSNSYAVGGSYNAGPLSASLTYVKGGIVPSTGTAPAPVFQGYFGNETVIGLGASYDFGVVKAFGQYTTIKQKADTITASVANKDKIYQVGVSVPVTDKASVLASYGKLSNKLTDAPATKETDAVLSVGYDYLLSKRTDVYGVFTNNQHTNKESGATFAVGVRHSF